MAKNLTKTDSNSGNYRGFTIRLAITIIVGFLIVDAYFIYTSYNDYLDKSEQEVMERLQAITSTAALGIDGDKHALLQEKFKEKDGIADNRQDSTYSKLQQKLNAVQRANNLSTNLYTLFWKDDAQTEDDQWNFYYGVTSQNPCFRHSYNTAPDVFRKQFNEGATIPVYTTENGKWISAFSPIKDAEGNVVAVVQADETFDNFITEAKGVLVRNLLISLLVLSIMAGVLFLLINRWVKISMAEQEYQNWLKTGQNNLNELLTGDANAQQIADASLKFVSEYLNAHVGITFVSNMKKSFKLKGTYGFDSFGDKKQSFKVGEGTLGQAVKDQQTHIMDPAPLGYLKVGSGLGEKDATSVIVKPLVFENDTVGLIELAFLRGIDDKITDLLESVAPTIAAAINSAITRDKVNELLVTTQEQSHKMREQQEKLTEVNEELEAQQEELRQANEELQEQTLQLQQSEEELRTQQEEIMQINRELEEKAKQLEIKNLSIIEQNGEMELAKRDLEKKADELETTSRYKSEFLANMSHELRTPLNSILLLSKLLSDNKGENMDSEQVEFSSIIHKSGNGLLALINEILDLSKIESGKMDIKIEPIELAELRTDTDALFRVLANDKGLEFITQIDPGVPAEIRTDRMRVDQVVKNMLSNAFKFTDKGGTVEMKAYLPDMSNHENEELRGRKDIIAIAVRDTGIGIPADKLGTVFEAFQQADGSTKRKYGGTGLGLSISKEIAHLLGGDLCLESTVGEGSTFTLYLPFVSLPTVEEEEGSGEIPHHPTAPPVAAPAPAPAAPAATPQPAPTIEASAPPTPPEDQVVLLAEELEDDKQNIQPDDKVMLIVEDDPTFARLMLNFSRERGFKGIVAMQGDRGLQLAKRYKPAAILLDNMLPVMDGMQVIDKIKADPELRHIPVHFISAIDMSKQSAEKGAIGYLMKPISKEQVMSAFDDIEKILNDDVRSILIVGKNEVTKESIMNHLQGGDVSFEYATTVFDAFSHISENKVDAVIIDLESTGSDLFELMDQISNDQRFGKLPLILNASRELTAKEVEKLEFYDKAIMVRKASSFQKLMDETNLFLHRVEQNISSTSAPTQTNGAVQDDALAGKKVLVVDDDVRNIFALNALLESEDMAVETANDGYESIEFLQNEPDVDVILMDIMMPGMDGYETIGQIRKMAAYKNTPIIAVTAKAMAGDREKCIEAGASDYVSKPIDSDQMLSVLKVWLHNG
ncbi:MAG: response regulator [Flavobacteriales bacterium]